MDASAPLAVRLLGGFRVALATHEMPAVAWRQRRAAAVVKLLALAPGHRLHREELAEALWPDLDPDAAANNLRVALHRARSGLEGAGAPAGHFLARDGEAVLLGPPDAVWVDVDAFEAAAARAWRSDRPAVADQALAAYSGDLLPEDPYEDWAAGRRSGLRVAFLALVARLAELHERRGALEPAIAALQRLLAAEPLDEAALARLLRLLALTGRARQAGDQYARFVARLADELGAEPEPATAALAAAIRDGRLPPAAPAPAAPDTAAPPAAPAEPSRGLPHPIGDLIGRDQEMAELGRLLRTQRLVTLTGPGGVGKTRLALAAAAAAVRDRPETASFVALAPLGDPDLVLPTIARAVGIDDAKPDALVDALATRLAGERAMLVLDNFEHVAAAAPAAVAPLLAACADLRIVVTSRVRLRLHGEQEYPVAPLMLPPAATNGELGRWRPAAADGGETGAAAVRPADGARSASAYPAVALFARRAGDARPDFALTDANAPAVVDICRRLDGLPLALELAAARVRVLPPAALLAHLDRPFAALATGPVDAPARHRTLWATIDWSYDLLSAEEQAFFRRLAVFAGGFTLDAAEAVASRGVEASRSREERRTHSSTPRRLDASTSVPVLDLLAALVDHSLLRQTAGADDAPRYAMLATIREYAAERLRQSPEEGRVRSRHAAYFLALAERAEPMLTGLDAAPWLETLEAEHDNLRAAAAILEAERESIAALRLAAALWRFWWLRGHANEGRRWLERALAGGNDAPASVRAQALDGAGVLAEAQGEHGQATELHLAALRLGREDDDRGAIVRSLTNLGLVADEQGDPVQATAWLEEALAVARGAGDRRGVAVALANLAQVASSAEAFAVAAERFGESAALFRELGDERSLAAILANLGILAFRAGDFGRAEQCHLEALALLRAFGDRQGEADELLNLGHTVQRRGDLGQAEALFAEALERFERLGDRGGAAFALTHLGRLAHLRGEDDTAERLIGQGLALGRQIEDQIAIVEALEGLLAVAGARGEAEHGARLIGAAAALREAIGVPLPAVHRADHERAVASIRASLGEPAFAAALAAGAAAGTDLPVPRQNAVAASRTADHSA